MACLQDLPALSGYERGGGLHAKLCIQAIVAVRGKLYGLTAS